jgi:hypothetical protein
MYEQGKPLTHTHTHQACRQTHLRTTCAPVTMAENPHAHSQQAYTQDRRRMGAHEWWGLAQ